jgi:uncharacterized membrane protein YkoI
VLLVLSLLPTGPACGQQSDKQRADQLMKAIADLEKLRARLQELTTSAKPAPLWVGSIKVEGKLSKEERVELARIIKPDAEQAALTALKNKDARIADVKLKVVKGYLVYAIDVAVGGGKEIKVIVDAGNGRVLDPPGLSLLLTRTGDRFTATAQEGGLTITLSGTLSDGQTRISEISVQDGELTRKYDDISKVPEPLRATVRNVIEAAEKRNQDQ